jgi:hypothetical protein
MITETLEPVGTRKSVMQGRISHRLRVGAWAVDAVFVTPPKDAEGSLSMQSGCLAEEVAAASLGLTVDAVRIAAVMPSGRPIAMVDGFPADVSVSISHLQGLGGAVACRDARVGLDIVDPADAGRGLDAWFTPDELALIPDEHGLLRALLWAAKEASYKAAHLDTEFRPRTVTIRDLTPVGFAWIARDRFADVHGTGCFIVVNRHIAAVAATSLWRTHSRSQTRIPETLHA